MTKRISKSSRKRSALTLQRYKKREAEYDTALDLIKMRLRIQETNLHTAARLYAETMETFQSVCSQKEKLVNNRHFYK
jgi:hypothetical protein